MGRTNLSRTLYGFKFGEGEARPALILNVTVEMLSMRSLGSYLTCSALALGINFLAGSTCFADYEGHQLIQQHVDASGVSALITVTQINNDIRIFGDFTSSSYRVSCISLYRDLQYDLRNSAGRAVSIDQKTLANPPFDEYKVPADQHYKIPIPKYRHVDCATNHVREHELVALLAFLYPRLPKGTYTLNMTFAPRRGTEKAAITPVRFTTTATGRSASTWEAMLGSKSLSFGERHRQIVGISERRKAARQCGVIQPSHRLRVRALAHWNLERDCGKARYRNFAFKPPFPDAAPGCTL